ncbi:Serine carboxypeptidase s28 family protein, partial [Thalictrum thalictroides]
DAYANYVKSYYLGSLGVSLQTYDQEYLKNTTVSEDSSDRLWWFQVCTEVAYFQVAPSTDSIRSSKIDSRYHLELCKNVFGEGVYPDVDATNIYYGGTKIADHCSPGYCSSRYCSSVFLLFFRFGFAVSVIGMCHSCPALRGPCLHCLCNALLSNPF